jgi:hypothetical protein
MTRYTIIQLTIMVAATAILYYFEHLVAASIVGGLTVVIATLALAAPGVLHTIQEMGKRAGVWVGNGIGVLLLTIVYFTLFVPGSLLLRIARIDLFNRRFPTRGTSNWLDRINYGDDKLLYKKSYSRPHTADGSKKATT